MISDLCNKNLFDEKVNNIDIRKRKAIIISFYLSYNKSNLPYNENILLKILNEFRYLNFKKIFYHSIHICYFFKNVNDSISKNTIIENSLYEYDSSNIYYSEYSKNSINYNIICKKNYNYMNLHIKIKIIYNKKNIYILNLKYIDIIKRKTNINLLFDIIYSYNIDNYINYNYLYNYNLHNNNSNYYNNYYNYINNYYNNYNNYIRNNNYNYTIMNLKYLIIPDIIKLF